MKFDEGWVKFFSSELREPYFATLGATVQNQRNGGKNIAPGDGKVFEAFKLTPFSSLKAVIVGGEPYSEPNLATGLAYSLPTGVKLTPELENIYTELHTSLNVPKPTTGNLTKWAESGILLLNNILTVEEKSPKSHKDLGWEKFTTNCVKYISENKDSRVVFCLWGLHAQRKAPFINKKKHLILKAPSPEQNTVDQGFKGCGHFIHLNQATRIWS